MAKIQIRGLERNDDPEYRYRMPLPEILYRKKKGGQTVIMNLDNIGRSLERSGEEIMNFIKSKVHARTDIETCTISGHRDENEILNILFEFIEYFVLCAECRYPETKYIKEGKKVKMMCKCCSHTQKLYDHEHRKYVKKMVLNGDVVQTDIDRCMKSHE